MARRAGSAKSLTLAAVLATGVGCQTPAWFHPDTHSPQQAEVVAPPDILRIDSPRLVPLSSHTIAPEDALFLVADGTASGGPIHGVYEVGADGTIDLGKSYGGPLRVAEWTTPEIERLLAERLSGFVEEPGIRVCLARAHGADAVRGEHLVRPDGTVRLGPYGSVAVAGRSLSQVRAAVETYLRRFLDRPEIEVKIAVANSKAVAETRHAGR